MEIQSNIPTPAPAIQFDEIKKASFWFSQLFIIIATVLGVFLAANQGFQQAVVFEGIQSNKANYYLRKSLQYELIDNIAIVKKYADNLQGPLELDTFIWDSMKFSPATLETPPDILSDVRRFYRESLDVKRGMSSGLYGGSHGRKLLLQLLDDIENNTLIKLQKDIQDLQIKLKQQDVEV